MIALLANTEKADRAAVTSLRNFIRTTGGAVGLSIGSSILNNVLVANLPPTVTAAGALQFTNLKDLMFEERDGVIHRCIYEGYSNYNVPGSANGWSHVA